MGRYERNKRFSNVTKNIKLTREEKASLTINRLLRAAAEAISDRGFAGASVAIIAKKAQVATGSFYTYFESREALLQAIITAQSHELRRQITAAVMVEAPFFVREERSFRQYFRFVRSNPSFIRLQNEAEAFLPDAYEGIKREIINGYRRVLLKASKKGEIRTMKGVELDGVALFLIAAKHYYGQQYLALCDRNGEIPDRIVEIYMNFVRGGLEPSP
ncbi:MAG: TetR/AcrR family transcriptional regulator [Burkholderiaceae bacterium]